MSELERPIPAFEGHIVDAVKVKVASSAIEEMPDVVVSVDDRVLMLTEYRVTAVKHTVDENTGRLVREQVLKPIHMTLHPWDPEDPSDDGVLRHQGSILAARAQNGQKKEGENE